MSDAITHLARVYFCLFISTRTCIRYKTSWAGKIKFGCDKSVNKFKFLRMLLFLGGLFKCLEGVHLPTSDGKGRRFVMDAISLSLSLHL